MRAVPIHDRRALEPSQDFDRHVGRHRVHEDEASGARARRADRIEHDDVRLAHAPLVLVGCAHLERHLRIGPEHLLEEEVAGADEQHRDLPRWRQDRIGGVVDVEVVVDPEPCRDGAPAAVAEREHHRPPHARFQRDLFLGDRLAVELESEAERLGLRGIVHERDEGLIVERAEVVLADRQAGDGDVLTAAPDAHPSHTGIGDVRTLGEREGAVGEDVDLGARLGRDEGTRRADGLHESGRQVTGLRGPDGRQRPLTVTGERRRHLRLHPGLDDHHLGALAEAAHEGRGARLRHIEPRGRDIARLHRRRGVQHDDDFSRALAHDRRHRPGQRQGERQEGQELEQQQRVAVEPLEERRGFTVVHRGVPQEQARHGSLAPPDLEEVEQHQGHGQGEERQGERSEKAHTRTRPRSWARTNSSTGASDETRWYPISLVRQNVSTRSRN